MTYKKLLSLALKEAEKENTVIAFECMFNTAIWEDEEAAELLCEYINNHFQKVLNENAPIRGIFSDIKRNLRNDVENKIKLQK